MTRKSVQQEITIRCLSDAEIPAAHDLAWRTFYEYEGPDYSAEGIETFRKCLHDPEYLKDITYYGAMLGEELVGLLGIRSAIRHICFYFVDGKHHRLGIGTKLFRHLLSELGERTFTLNASPFGVPFYLALGFTPASEELTTHGIRYTPMVRLGAHSRLEITKLSEHPELMEQAASWFSSHWGISSETYLESMRNSQTMPVPAWYVIMDEDKIISGMGVIENDFHDRKDLAPNVCAVYTELWYRKRGLCRKLLDYVCADQAAHGINTLYLITSHTGLYERYGWEFLCTAMGDGEESPSRIYVHRQN